MKIALLTDGIYPYVVGGMQKHSYLLAKYLVKNDVQVNLYHCNQSDLDITKLELFTEEEKKNIRSFVIEFPKRGNLPGHYMRESYEYSVKIFNWLKKHLDDVDFIYAKGFTAWKLLDEKQKGLKCPPVGVNFHGYEMFQKPPGFRAKLEQSLLLKKPVLFNVQHADCVFSYGGKITNIIAGLGVKKNKILEIPAGIEEDWLVNEPAPVHTPRKFVFVGRYERRKGVEELNKALGQLIGKEEFEFHFVGAIPVKKQIKSTQIIYHGPINEAGKIKDLLRSCDVLVCPSHSEGMPNVILEAMASGLAVIATDVGAVAEMVSPGNGVLLQNAAIDPLARALHEMIACSDERLQKMKTHSLTLVQEKFMWNKIVSLTITQLAKMKG